MLLSDRDLIAELKTGKLDLQPFEPALIQPSSIDVRLDRWFRVFNNHLYTHIDPAKRQDDLTAAVEVADGQAFVLHPGEFVLASTLEVITLGDELAGRLEGKALALSTEVPTPTGWRTMADIAPGDVVFDRFGEPCSVLGATPPMSGRPCYEVVLADDTTIIADAGHRWLTRTRSERKHGRPPGVRTTVEIRDSLRTSDGWNHHIPLTEPARYPERELPVDPYRLGELLCDAGATGLLRDPRVFEPYLRGAIPQRRALLRGLFDRGGRHRDSGQLEFATTDFGLAELVAEVTASLGMSPCLQKLAGRRRGIDRGPEYRVAFARTAAACPPEASGRARAIVAVRPVESRPVRCIEVSSPTGTFLVTRRYVPTHNSSLGRLGLLTHSTAGFIDPGFSGHVTLELSNVANLPITLWPGMKIGQLCIFRLSSPAEHPYGSAVYGSRYQGQRGPTPSRAWQNWRVWPTGSDPA